MAQPGVEVKFAGHLAPNTSATSAPASAADRAGFTFRSWLSGTTPRPMAVARNGRPAASTNARSAESAWEYAAPLPMTTSGLRWDRARIWIGIAARVARGQS